MNFLPGWDVGAFMAGGGPAFPEIMGTPAKTEDGTVAGSHNANLPAGIVAGETLVLVCYQVGSPSPAPSGWTLIVASSVYRLAAYQKLATGSEGSSVAVAFQSGFTDCFTAIAFRVKGAIMFAGAASADPNATGPPDPPNLSPGWGTRKILWISCGYAARSASADVQIDGYPSGFTLAQTYAQTNGPSLIKQRLAIAGMNDEVSSKNPPAFSSTPTSGGPGFVAATLAIA